METIDLKNKAINHNKYQMKITNEELPDYFSKYVSKSINLPNQALTNLVGFPEHVLGDIDVRRNEIISLLGCPEVIGGVLELDDNKLSSLDYLPKKVKKISIQSNFILDLSKITNVEFTGTIARLVCPYYKNSALLPLLYVSNYLILIDDLFRSRTDIVNLIDQYNEYNKANIFALQTDLIINGFENNALWTPL